MLVSDEREVVFRWRLRGGDLTGDSDFRGREIREIAGFGWGIGRHTSPRRHIYGPCVGLKIQTSGGSGSLGSSRVVLSPFSVFSYYCACVRKLCRRRCCLCFPTAWEMPRCRSHM